jgi:uncharacterized protein YggE
MRTTKSLVLVLLVSAVLLSACGAIAPSTASQTQLRTINVNGTSQVTMTPDIAYASIGVHTEAEDAQSAVEQNNQQSQAVIDALVAAGVDPKDIQTTNFSIYPQDKYSPTGELQGKYYAVDNTVYVKVRDLESLGSLMDSAVAAGANTIYGISFDVENKEAAMEQGRTEAIDNAYQQALQLAEAAGVTLGEVYTISSYSSAPVPMAYYDMKAIGGAGEAMSSIPISTGQMILTVDVNVVYEIQ